VAAAAAMRFDFVLPVLYNDGDIAWNDALGGTLERRGASVAYIAHTRYGQRELEKKHANVFYLYDGFDADAPVSLAAIGAVEKKYDLGSLADFVYPEQVVPGAQHQEMLFRRALHDFRFLEDFCARNDVRMFVNNLGPELIRRCMFRMRDKGGPQSVVVDFAPLHGRIAVTTQETDWDDLPKTLPTLSPAERAEMVAFVEKATAERKAFYPPGALSVSGRNFVNAARYAKRFLSERVDVRLPALVYQRAESMFRVRAARMLYEQPPPGERFYFFPLHIADDSAITIRAPQFQRQEEVIRYIAERVLPVGVKLYVKPHIAAMHAYSHAMLSELASIPNVRLVDARIVAHQLIREAEAMIVINSTVGFESLLYGKPVVVLGRVFYRGKGITTDVDQLADLRGAVPRAVENPPDRERIYRFLHACHQATYPGHLTQQTPENLDAMASALFAKAAKLGMPVGGAPSDDARVSAPTTP
jgi:capsular polysaccharide export protein